MQLLADYSHGTHLAPVPFHTVVNSVILHRDQGQPGEDAPLLSRGWWGVDANECEETECCVCKLVKKESEFEESQWIQWKHGKEIGESLVIKCRECIHNPHKHVYIDKFLPNGELNPDYINLPPGYTTRDNIVETAPVLDITGLCRRKEIGRSEQSNFTTCAVM